MICINEDESSFDARSSLIPEPTKDLVLKESGLEIEHLRIMGKNPTAKMIEIMLPFFRSVKSNVNGGYISNVLVAQS